MGKEVYDLGSGGSLLLEGCLRERQFFRHLHWSEGKRKPGGGVYHSPVAEEKCYSPKKGFKSLLKLSKTPTVLGG